MSIPPARKEQAPQVREDPPSLQPERRVQEPRSRLRMPGWLRWVLITLTSTLLAVATFVAQRQAPHPDMFRPVADWDIGKADWWAYPLERNAFKRRVVVGSLSAVFVLPNTQNVWAVGDGGLVLHSADGGSNWVQQRPAVAAHAVDGGRQARAGAWSPFSEALAGEQPDPKQQAAPNLAAQQKLNAPPLSEVAANPAAQVVNPGGIPDSSPKAAPAPAKPLSNKITPIPAAPGAVDAKADAKAPEAVPAPTGPGPDRADLNAVFFATERLGWAVGDFGTILATRDGGNVWTPQTSGTQNWLTNVHFTADGQRGWAVGGDGTILATGDGGNVWTAQTSGTQTALNSVHFTADGQHGWAVGSNGTILATGDGGNLWTRQTSGTQALLNSVHFTADGQRGWAVGSNGTILATRDGGNKWTPQTSGTQATLSSVHFTADGQRGWAVGSNGTILATGDGGNVWTAQTSGTQAALNSVHFTADGQRGWAVGWSGTILATGDGGNAWTRQTSGTQAWLSSVHFTADGQRGWAVGDYGTILATGDGDSSWTPQTSDTLVDLTSVQFTADGQRGWAVGDYGTILATGDGGNAWTRQTSDTLVDLNSVQFTADGQRGWTVGWNGTILATGDGGSSWTPQTSDTLVDLTSVHVTADGQRGWAVGDYGTIIATGDGGRLWSASAPYQRYWAPWYFATLALLAFTLFVLLGLVETVQPGSNADTGSPLADGAATLLRSDQPVADKLFDRLGVRPAVEALSSFIRNRDTEPRVTIAVTGEWGNGKSSVMRMLQTELEHAGFHTAWFNAWHHQQEGRQLTALFEAVRKQAVPRWWLQPVSALRVRSRLIWGRGGFYQSVTVATALLAALLAGDLLADGWRSALDRLRLNVAHHVLQERRTAITGASLAKLDPFAKTVASAASAPAKGTPESASAAPDPAKTPGSKEKLAAEPDKQTPASTPAPAASPGDHCDPRAWPTLHKAEPIRPALYCYLQSRLQWEESGDDSHCGVQHASAVGAGQRCVFASGEELIATLDAHAFADRSKLWPSEKKAILSAAETLPPPPVFPWFENFLVGGLAGFLLLLFAKGITVYGVQLAAPLRAWLAASTKDADGGKEASGTIERYRAEFSLLCDALGGRLVIFIDDLDRCTPATVNGMLELTNYLVDIGKCFVVIGAAMERVKRCVKSPVEDEDRTEHDAYATAYLRKLVHIELPVPHNRALLEGLAGAEATAGPADVVRSQAWHFAGRGMLVVGAVAVLALVFIQGERLPHGGEAKALQVLGAPPAVVSEVVKPKPTDLEKPVPMLRSERISQAVGLMPTPLTVSPFCWLGATVLLALAGLLLSWLRRHRDKVVLALGGALRAEDSDRFMRALKIWNPVVVSYDPTPRHVKRFYNRARLFAAYETQGNAPDATRDESLVALAAMHHLDPALLGELENALASA